ncbi:hypothetical protein D3C71_1285900 [compost metagenome]
MCGRQRRALFQSQGRNLEGGNHVDQLRCLGVEAAGCCRHFLHQCRVLLGGLVHLGDGFVHLVHALALLGTGCADLRHDVGNAANRRDHIAHGLACPVHEGGAGFYPLHTGADQHFDFARGVCGSACQVANLARNHCKAPALFTRTGGLHGGVQGQDVRLEGDAVNDTDDVRDLAGAVVDVFHRADHVCDNLAALACHVRRVLRELIGLPGVLGVLANRRVQLLHRCCGFFQCTGLVFGACREIAVARRYLRAGSGHAVGALAYLRDNLCQRCLHVGERLQQRAEFIVGVVNDLSGQVAIAHAGCDHLRF